MNSKITYLFLLLGFFCTNLFAQVSITATSGTLSGSYTTLKGTFDKINDGTHQGVITISITANTSETASAVLNNSGNGASSYTSVSISPSGGAARTISGSITTYLIDLNGADNVTINGLNSGSNSLILQNTNTTAGASAIRFVSDATNNTIQNTTLKSTAAGAAGVVFFSTGSNASNTINTCNIDGNAGAQMGIYSTGTGNNNITVSNCNIYDCFVNGQTATHGGIYASSGSSAWTITGNSIYQTSTRTVTANTTYYGIAIANASAVGNTISSNYIGGSSASCGGSKFTIAGSYDNIFHGVYVNVGTASASNVQGNTIANLSITSTAASTNFFYGINVQGGYVNVGSTTGNTIGNNSVDASSSANISLSAVISAQTATALGIYASATTLAVSNNNIGGINFTNTNDSYGGKFYAIRTATSSAAMSITSNVIGSTSTATNIKLGSSSTTSGVFEFYGIANAATGVMTINSNTVKNIIVYGTAASLIAPIYNTGATDNSTISNNIISTISNSGTGSGGINYGIYQSAVASFTLVNNIISSYTINNGSFNGLCLNVGSTNSKTFTITSNTIKSITAALTTGANTVGKYCGIYISSNGNTYNLNTNLIQSLSGTNSTSYYYINGIYTVGVTNQPLINLSGNIIEKLINGSTSTGSTNSVYGVEITSTSSSSSIIKKNIIRYLAMSGATTNSNISGISLSSTNNTLENNFVRINNDDGTSTFATIRTVIKGLSTPGSGATNVLYYNTIVIGGTTPDLVNTQSYCVYIPTGGTHTMKNNIFQNTRVGNTSNLGNYTLYTGSAGGSTTTFNNNYYANTTSSTFAFYNGSAKSESTYNNTLYGGTSSSFSLTGLTIATDGAVTETASITGIIDLYTTGGTDCREDLYGNSLIRNVSGQSGAHQGCYESGQSNYYWVAGTGNWSDYSNHWAFVSGGPACATAVPSSSSNVYFDANSSAGTCTIDAAANANDVTMTGYTGTLAGTYALDIYGSLTVGSGTTWTHTGSTTFKATASGKSITTNGVTLATPITFNGVGGVWTLADNLTLSTSSEFILTSGTLNLGATTLSIAGDFTKATGFTFNSNTGTVKFTGNTSVISGTTVAPSFYNITVNKTAGQTLSLGGSAASLTCTNNLTLTSGKLNMQGFTLTIGTNIGDGSITGGSATSYIVAYDSGSGTPGKVAHYINANNVLHNYPIGDLTYYTPLTFTLTANTLLTNATFTVFTKAVQIPNMSTAVTNYLTRYWDGTQSGISNPTYSISYIYNDVDIHGVETNFAPVKKSGTTWYSPTGSLFTNGTKQGTSVVDIANNTLTWNGLTTFSLYSAAADAATALPITLFSFNARPYDNQVIITWKTASEYNNDYFTVERSENGYDFNVIGTIKGAGNSSHLISYYLLDPEYFKGINYYRLKQTDFNGNYTFSNIVAVDMSLPTGTIVMTVNSLGQVVQPGFTGLVFDIYSDGTSVKRIQ